MRAEALSQGDYIGAVTFSRTGDPAAGDFSDGTVNRGAKQRAGRSKHVYEVCVTRGGSNTRLPDAVAGRECRFLPNTLRSLIVDGQWLDDD